jgi:hypothetical protein
MKKTNYLLFSFFVLIMLFNSCSTEVDIYADYKDITVVYGLLDSDKDTNYVKINRAFLGPGNAYDIALIADSCNYPNKLDARIIEYRSSISGNNYQKTREMVLDTLTITNKKQDGFFYAPRQLVYYTKDPIHSNTASDKYKYELLIDRGDTILSSETSMVGGYNFDTHFNFYINTAIASFSAEYGSPIKFYPCPNAAIYEVVLKFRFTEVGPYQDSVHHCMEWSLGTYTDANLYENIDHGQYVVNHKSSIFYSELAEYLGKHCDTVNSNVTRIIQDRAICISISAGGEELYNFISVNGPSSSIVQNIPEYSNIKGGYGVFSSRTMLEKWVNFNSLNDLKRKHPNWNFEQG